MEVAHDSIFGGHLGIKKSKNRIQTNFYWPGMQDDVTTVNFGYKRFRYKEFSLIRDYAKGPK